MNENDSASVYALERGHSQLKEHDTWRHMDIQTHYHTYCNIQTNIISSSRFLLVTMRVVTRLSAFTTTTKSTVNL